MAATLAVLSGLSQWVPSVQAQEGGAEKRGGVIRYGHFQEPACLFGGWVQQWYLQRQYSDNLVARSDDGKIAPWLAESWTISDDQKGVHIRDKAKCEVHGRDCSRCAGDR
ncbi:hypothetical protein [Bradyrhizobium sp. USDA 4451]